MYSWCMIISYWWVPCAHWTKWWSINACWMLGAAHWSTVHFEELLREAESIQDEDAAVPLSAANSAGAAGPLPTMVGTRGLKNYVASLLIMPSGVEFVEWTWASQSVSWGKLWSFSFLQVMVSKQCWILQVNPLTLPWKLWFQPTLSTRVHPGGQNHLIIDGTGW